MAERLINANEARVVAQRIYSDPVLVHVILNTLKNTPTADAAPVVHGRWEWYTDRCEDLFLGCDEAYGWRCSQCKVALDAEDDPEVMPTFRYCPNCGTKMDGDLK
jgi:hypothetical protein